MNKLIKLLFGDTFDASFHKETTIENDLFMSTKNFFTELIKQINDKQGVSLSLNDVLFVPGNHEIEQHRFKNETNIEKLFEKFKKFLDFFYDKNIPETYDMNSLSLFKKMEKEKIIIIGFNSTTCDKKKNFGEINIEHLDFVTNKLLKVNHDDYNIVVLLHHHFYQFEERNKSHIDNSSLRNQETFLTNLSNYNITTILHGHKHENIIRRININNDLRKADKMTTAIACGSTSKKDVSFNNFNVVKIYAPDDQLTLKLLEYEKNRIETFKLINEYTIPINKNDKISNSLESLLKQSPEYYKSYEDLRDFGVDSKKFIGFLNNTVGQCSRCCEILENNKKAILHMFLIAHHRANFNNSDIKDKINDINDNDVFLSILTSKDIYDLNGKYKKEILPTIETCSQSEKQVIIFSLISFYISYFHYTLNQSSGQFFDSFIKQKADLHVKDKNEINNGIKNNIIEISSNVERRAIDVRVECSSALSHKVVTLIIKEFELILATYEKDFDYVGFKMYYVAPTIYRPKIKDSKLESHTFTAYMHTLLNLLAGDHIYSDKMVFIRELIQNSIDAIALRGDLDDNFSDDKGKIEINIKENKNGKTTLAIKDNGVGMTKYHIERYLTTVGRSFYKSDEFINTDSEIKYKPISRFGIGFLSCFNVSESINVKTKYWNTNIESNSNRLDIPNIDGCFFIDEENKNDIGTIIELVIDPEKIKGEKSDFSCSEYIESLNSYIRTSFCNIQYEISCNADILVEKNAFITELKKDTAKYGLLFEIPLTDEGIIREDTDTDNNDYGIFIYKRDKDIYTEVDKICMCNGIRIKNFYLPMFFEAFQNNYFDIAINLSSRNIELEVSRDKIKKINFKGNKEFKSVLDKKINNYISKNYENYKDLPYYFLYMISPNNFPLNELTFFCDTNKNLCIGLTKESKYSIARDLLPFFFSNTKVQIDTDQKFNNLATYMRFYLKQENISEIRKDLFVDEVMNKAINKVMANAETKYKAKYMARDTANAKIKAKANPPTPIVVAKYMANYMDMYMIEYMLSHIGEYMDANKVMSERINSVMAEAMDENMDEAMNKAMNKGLALALAIGMDKDWDILTDEYISDWETMDRYTHMREYMRTDMLVAIDMIKPTIINDHFLSNIVCFLLSYCFRRHLNENKTVKTEFTVFCASIQLIPVFLSSILPFEYCQKNHVINLTEFFERVKTAIENKK